MIIGIALIGFGLSGTFSLALSFLGLRARNARQASQLSGMAQSLGYIFAAVGPMLIGYIYDFSEKWTVPIITLIIIVLLTAFFGYRAGQDRYV
jgi:CP family cyanate transporter-like MFS transporter